MTVLSWLSVCGIVAIIAFLAGGEFVAYEKRLPQRKPEWLRVDGATPEQQQAYDRAQALRDCVTEECYEVLEAYFGGRDSNQFSSLFAILMKHGERIDRI